MPTFNVVGAGRVGKTLARLFHQAGLCTVQDVGGRTQASAAEAVTFIGAGRPVVLDANWRPADVWMLSVPDTQIAATADALAHRLPVNGGQASVAFHCSGYTVAEALAPLRRQGFRLASVHPNTSFADPSTAMAQFAGTPCGLEGDEPAWRLLQPWFEGIGGVCFPVRSADKALYHAAAVFSNNFAVVLQAVAREAWSAAGVPDDVAQAVHAALLRATVTNVLQQGPAAALTGPAARGDDAVVRAQGDAVAAWQPQAGDAYRLLSQMARQLAVSGTPFARPGDDAATERR